MRYILGRVAETFAVIAFTLMVWSIFFIVWHR